MKLRLTCAAVLLVVACANENTADPEQTLTSLVRAVDQNPDPRIVEVTLVAAPGLTEYLDGVQTSVLGFRDGAVAGSRVTVPGPLIEATVGDRFIVHFRNELPSQNTTVHWHGLRLPVMMDGNPMVSGPVEPGGTFEYDFVLRDAGFFWYHPHVDTDEQLELGLQGPLVVHEAEPPEFDLERYLVLDDVALDDDGSVDIELRDDDVMFGRRDGIVIVNGHEPATAVGRPDSIERWRLVNSSNGRFFHLEADGADLTVIGWDGGFVTEPYPVQDIVIAPGERYDVTAALPSEGQVRVHSLPFARMDSTDAAVDLLTIELAGDPVEAPRIPSTAREIARLPTDGMTWPFRLSSDPDSELGPSFFINNQRWPLNSVLTVRAGDTDVWEVINEEKHDHPFHIHGLFFQVIDRNGVPEPPTLGWKDTVVVGPEETVRLAVPYDEPGMWMYHCQIPEHAELGMMSDLEVLLPE